MPQRQPETATRVKCCKLSQGLSTSCHKGSVPQKCCKLLISSISYSTLILSPQMLDAAGTKQPILSKLMVGARPISAHSSFRDDPRLSSENWKFEKITNPRLWTVKVGSVLVTSCTGLQLPIPGAFKKKPWCIDCVTYVWQPPDLGNPLPLEGRQLKSLQDLPEQRRLFQTSLHVRWRSSQGEGKYLGSHIQKEMWPGRLGGRWGQTFKCLKTVCCKVWCFSCISEVWSWWVWEGAEANSEWWCTLHLESMSPDSRFSFPMHIFRLTNPWG